MVKRDPRDLKRPVKSRTENGEAPLDAVIKTGLKELHG